MEWVPGVQWAARSILVGSGCQREVLEVNIYSANLRGDRPLPSLRWCWARLYHRCWGPVRWCFASVSPWCLLPGRRPRAVRWRASVCWGRRWRSQSTVQTLRLGDVTVNRCTRVSDCPPFGRYREASGPCAASSQRCGVVCGGAPCGLDGRRAGLRMNGGRRAVCA